MGNEMLSDLDIECVRAYAEHNMSASEAAKAIYMHRNTLVYRLDEVWALTGLNPRNFYDLVKLLDRFGDGTSTNADRIRKMTDKELAEKIVEWLRQPQGFNGGLL